MKALHSANIAACAVIVGGLWLLRWMAPTVGLQERWRHFDGGPGGAELAAERQQDEWARASFGSRGG